MSYNSKIAAVIGNGPSRILYDESKEYLYRIGCNIPWTRVDATVLLDVDLLTLMQKDKSLLKYPAYFSAKAWMFADSCHLRAHFYSNNLFLGLIGYDNNDSSGNVACKKLIEEGYTEIDLYGCDSYFTETHGYNTESYTRNFVPAGSVNNSYRWKLSWDAMIKKHPDIKFNFIGK